MTSEILRNFPSNRRDLALRSLNVDFLLRQTGGQVEKARLLTWPTLADLNHIYGHGMALQWMRAQFQQLHWNSTSRDTSLTAVTNACANAFTAEVMKHRYQISDLLIFFQRYAAGLYQSTIGPAFDPRKISTAFWTLYLPQRKQEIAAEHSAEEEEKAAAREAQRALRRCPRSTYLDRLRQWASTSDPSLRSSLFASLSNPAISPSDNLALLTAAAAHNNIPITPSLAPNAP